MNVLAWLAHIAVLTYSWPLIRLWWHGDATLGFYGGVPLKRNRTAVVASFLLPIIAWFWLAPLAVAERHRQEDLARVRRQADQARRRAQDVAFWREQVAQGDLVSAAVGLELLTSWGASIEREPQNDPDFTAQLVAAMLQPVKPQALPGAHPYSGGCSCRNCERARRLGAYTPADAKYLPPTS